MAHPSARRQREYIQDNVKYLNKEDQKLVYRVVRMEIGDGDEERLNQVFFNHRPKGITIWLEKIDNPELIKRVYNIVRRRIEDLSQPNT